MSCSVCEGHNDRNCPCCGEGVEMVECPDCLSEGDIYLGFDMILRNYYRVTRHDYFDLPDNEDEAARIGKAVCKGEIDACSTCHGEGVIPEEDY